MGMIDSDKKYKKNNNKSSIIDSDKKNNNESSIIDSVIIAESEHSLQTIIDNMVEEREKDYH